MEMLSRPMRARNRLALALTALVAAAAGCGSKAPAITGLLVTVTMNDVNADQLSVVVTTMSGDVVHMPVGRPPSPNGPLEGQQSVSIFLPDALATQVVTATVTPMMNGGRSGAPESNSAMLIEHVLVPLAITLEGGGLGGAGGEAGTTAGGGSGGAGGLDGGAGASGGGGTSDGGVDASEAGSDGPALKALGQPCATSDECDNSVCVDNVCCESPCSGTCQYCAQKGKEGTCINVAAGAASPRANGTCTDQGQSQCSFNGKCDGNGGCQQYAAGLQCRAASCNGASYVPASDCDGAGHCMAAIPVGCTPFNCSTSGGAPACLVSCVTGGTGDCASPAVCTAGSCGARPLQGNGAGCTADSECTSTHCADGVCCGTPCTASCMACNVVGSEGMCVAVPAGTPDPRKVCTDAGVATCGHNGKCDGKGMCAVYPMGAICAPGSCKMETLHPAHQCDGKGTCLTPSDVDCMNYKCDAATTACLTSCTSSGSQCAPRHICLSNACQ
jgi:hypothetical protein